MAALKRARFCGGTLAHNWFVFLDREIERLGPEAAWENEELWQAREADDPAEEAELLRQAEKIRAEMEEDDYALRQAQEAWMAQGRPPPPGAEPDTGGP